MVKISPPTMFKHHRGITPEYPDSGSVWYGMLVSAYMVTNRAP